VPHHPKTAALLAYRDDALSEEGVRRIEAHLGDCAICREALGAIDAYESLVDDVRATPTPPLPLEPMEERLAEEAERISQMIIVRRERRRWVPVLGFALAAVGLFAFLPILQRTPAPATTGVEAARTPSAEPGTAGPRPAVPEVHAPAPLTPTVTLLAGAVDPTLEVGGAIDPTATIRTGEAGLIHLALSEGTGLVVHPETVLRFERADADTVEVALATGAVSQQVAPLAEGQRYVVHAGDWSVEVRGTRFAVATDGASVQVSLDEGVVETRGPDGAAERLLAPARWASPGADGAPPDVRAPQPPPRDGGRVVELTGLGDWTIDGQAIPGAFPGGLSVLLAPGPHVVVGRDEAGRPQRFELDVTLSPTAMRVAPDAAAERPSPRARRGELPEEAIARVVRAGQRRLQRCYEGRVRRRPDLAAPVRATLRIGLDAEGAVRRAGLADGGIDGPLEACILQQARRWSFPAPGGPMTFEVPLSFRPTAP
jgi:hypothetical protein